MACRETAGPSSPSLGQGSRRPAQRGKGFQEGGLEAPGRPRPQHLGLPRKPAGSSTWPPGGNTISVRQ